MRYRNASEVLPDALLAEIKKYAAGEVLYIPSDSERGQWGVKSGAKVFYEQRNAEIRDKYFRQKSSVGALSGEYGLSEETIRKILYK